MIDRSLTVEILREQVKQIEDRSKKYGWEIEVKDTTVYVKLKSSRDNEIYMLRMKCENYPEKIPRVEFVDSSYRVPKLRAWPIMRPKAGKPIIQTDRMFICFAPGSGPPCTVGEIVQLIQNSIDSDDYRGRHPG